MCNDQAGVVGGGFPQGNQNGLFGMGVETGCRFIEDQYPRVFKYGTRNGNPLLFTTGQLQPAFTHNGVIPLCQFCDEFGEMGQLCRLFDFVTVCIGFCIGDVVAQGFIKQHRILGHDADGLAQTVLCDFADILVVDKDLSRGDVIETEQQACQRGFSCATGADNGDLLARCNGEADVMQDRSPGVIGK